jgi:hypothetical protein
VCLNHPQAHLPHLTQRIIRLDGNKVQMIL